MSRDRAGKPGTTGLVSFVMPVWEGRPNWLVEAVESTLGQVACRLELIVVDDGCADPVANTLAGIPDERLRILRTDHGGPYRARNAGFAASRGDWIRFVDSDDLIERSSTARLLRLLGEADDVIAYGATLVCDEQLRPRKTVVSSVQGDARRACLLGRFNVYLPSLLFPRAVLDATGEWEPVFPVSGDWDFVLRSLDHARVRGDASIATYYRRHPSSFTRGASIAAGEDAARRIQRRYFERHPSERGTKLHRQADAAVSIDRGLAYAYVGNHRACLTRLGRALALDPSAGTKAIARLFVERVHRGTRAFLRDARRLSPRIRG